MRQLLVVLVGSIVMVGGVIGTAEAERASTAPITVTGTLIDANPAGPHCGRFEVWTVLAFDVSADPKAPHGTKVDPKKLPVAVPCVEMTRAGYSKTAGNAGVLAKGKAYVLTLELPATGNWGNRLAWKATKIDEPPKSK